MDYRSTDRLDATLSAIGLGTWQLGADWGDVSEADATAVLDASVAAGVTFFDTADVYGDGRSERVIGTYLDGRAADAPDVFVATKMGRRGPQHPDEFTLDNFRAWTERSRENLRTDTLDLVQLHCPPSVTLEMDQVFDDLDLLVDEGVMNAYGVSVETAEEALAAIERPNVASIQIIINAFRLKPLERVLPAAIENGVAIFARVPLASGLLTGKYTKDTVFAENDHRNYNRSGEAFDVGETFSGVDFETGLAAADEFSALAASVGLAPSTAALAWVSQLPGVTSVIPGARNVRQAEGNAAAGSVEKLDITDEVTAIYDTYFRAAIHHRW